MVDSRLAQNVIDADHLDHILLIIDHHVVNVWTLRSVRIFSDVQPLRTGTNEYLSYLPYCHRLHAGSAYYQGTIVNRAKYCLQQWVIIYIYMSCKTYASRPANCKLRPHKSEAILSALRDLNLKMRIDLPSEVSLPGAVTAEEALP